MWSEKRQEFDVMVQQMQPQELEQLHSQVTDSNQLRLVELELQRHEMIRADVVRNSPPTQDSDAGNEAESIPIKVLPDERSLEFDRQMGELTSTRSSLAFSAARGDSKAERKLDEIEREISALLVTKERAQLAEDESHRRAVEDKRRKDEGERSKREARLSELAHQRLGIAEDMQSHIETVVEHVSALLEIGGEMENLALSVGRQGHFLRPRDNVVSYLNTSLAALLPYDFPFPHSSRRRTLVEMEGSLLSDLLSSRQSK
ncbi:MAG: hypothetical protein M3454_11825 [Actinomycetota bacterium]|nr:hypothetical protein [Actinomycetota bacterium]